MPDVHGNFGPTDELGAYGLRLANVERARALLVKARTHWPRVEIKRRRGLGESAHDVLTESAATIKLQNGGEIAIDREPGRATFILPRPVRTAELVHPLLAPVGAVMAYWHGRESFHAGAFIVGGRAWGVIGERSSGKSTTLARLALDGVPILSDDLLVVENGRVLAGPRAVDLRQEPAEQLSAGEALGMVGARERWRLRLDPVTREVELGGWVFLAWGVRVEAVRVAAGERIVRLHANLAVRVPPRDPGRILDLATLPAWELRRPERWDSLQDAVECLAATVA